MKPLVYVAGPYSGGTGNSDPVENTHRIIKIGTQLVNDGFVTPLLPHLSLLWQVVDPHASEYWYAYDLELLAHCDALLRVGGPSVGADQEVRKAYNDIQIPVFFEKAKLYRWVRKSWRG